MANNRLLSYAKVGFGFRVSEVAALKMEHFNGAGGGVHCEWKGQ